MKRKIIIGFTLLLLVIGIAAATDVNNLKVPDGWKAIGGGSYHQQDPLTNGGNGQNMMIQKWDDSFKDEYFQNITAEQYFFVDKGDNTYMYTDGINKDSGSFEVVEIDGTKYFVLFSTVDDLNAEEVAKTYQFMTEFNKLNNLKPIEV